MRSLRLLSLVVATAAFAPVAGHAQRTTAAASARVAPAAKLAPAPVLLTFQIDPVHSELSFRIRHLLGRVAGTFGEWGGTIVVDSTKPNNSTVNVEVKTATIDTRVAQRNAHLRTNDFFAADSFPTMTFRSTKVEVMKGDRIRVTGDLTLRGRTKPVVLTGQYAGIFKDPWGKTRTAFTASTTINRQDYGVAWNGMFEKGTQLGDEVAIEIAVEAVRQ